MNDCDYLKAEFWEVFFVTKSRDLTEDWRKLHNEEF
jgi:hypothetical protein